MSDKFIVKGLDGKPITHLNESLARRQNVSDDQLQALRASHVLRHTIFELAKANVDHPTTLKMLAKVFDDLESEQQRLWNFPVDPNHHRFFDMPGCTCPKMDNAERLGTKYHIYAEDCPIHGGKLTAPKYGRIMLDDGDLEEMSAEEKRQRYILEHGI